MDRTLAYTTPGGVKFALNTGSGFLDLGNMASTTLDRALKVLDHYSNRGGIRAKDKSKYIEKDMKFTANFDEVSLDNLKIAFGAGSVTNDSISSSEAIIDEIVELTGTDTTPFFLPLLPDTLSGHGVTLVTDLTGEDTYAVTTDYITDTVNGGIHRVADSTITDGEQVRVNYNWNKPPNNSFSVFSGQIVIGSAKFLMNPTSGPAFLWEIPRIQVATTGNISFDDQKWQELPLELMILFNATTPDDPYGTMTTWVN